MLKCETTCRGDPGAVFLISTMRTSTFPAQGINTITRPLLLKSLHQLERNEKRHLHRVLLTDREGENADEVSILTQSLLQFFLIEVIRMYIQYILSSFLLRMVIANFR